MEHLGIDLGGSLDENLRSLGLIEESLRSLHLSRKLRMLAGCTRVIIATGIPTRQGAF